MKQLKYAAIGVAALFLVIVFIVFALNPDQKAAVNRPFTKFENVKPPAAGVPNAPTAISGIYRNLATATLQLRGNGQYTLTDEHGADAGTFTLSGGHFAVRSVACDGVLGSYTVLVTGRQEAGQASLVFTAGDDSCAKRRTALTAKPWVYANS